MISKVLALAACAALILRAGPPGATDVSLHLSPEQWAQDVDFFAHELPQRHVNAFHHLTRQQFDAAIADLRRRLPKLNGDEVYVGLDSIANAIGDAHTYIRFPPDSANLPLDVRNFGGDYRVVVVGPGLEKALGARVVKIGDTPITKACELAASMTPAPETAALADARIADFLTTGILLHGLGIIHTRDVASYTFADDGKEFTLTVHAELPEAHINWVNLVKDPPLYRQHPGEDFWYVYLSESRTLYCNFRAYPRLYKNAPALFQEAANMAPDKLVIDLRQNGGGDYTVGLKHLIDPIAGLSKLNRRGHLFVLIGVNTFSAAMSNAAQFRQRTAAILVGEPIGERPNSFQEVKQMTLPNSHLVVRYSTKYYEFVESGENLIRPDHEVVTTWDDYKAGRDPVLDWVLQYK